MKKVLGPSPVAFAAKAGIQGSVLPETNNKPLNH
jgi:hypothetical protein